MSDEKKWKKAFEPVWLALPWAGVWGILLSEFAGDFYIGLLWVIFLLAMVYAIALTVLWRNL